MAGKPWTEERKRRHGELMRGNTFRRGKKKPTGPRGPLSAEHRRRISETLKKHPYSHWLGKTMPAATKLKMSLIRRGVPKTEEWKAKRRETMARQWGTLRAQKEASKKGLKWSVERRLAWSERKRGAGNNNWKDGSTRKSKLVRSTWQYREWSEAVRNRDGKCLLCGSTENLHAHHIERFIKHPEKRFDLSNGMTLCKTCHFKEHHGQSRVA